ncbi:ser thr protein phosphatase family protein, putative [Ichthyophthirius multifiliis]|uniref:Serine/threonine-protein phosphatase n=1 Tax=Ichthyophthirius multifiliis TaxID=5932 RepID=G0R2L5_ICHMU|nr:ser thr protein phosphatase family protein, putative [Ichthyophthirius multifiliis]EGR28279.1 ser thr protein phosphatase family protein, putative [Ichthyophthirius multifiliis]|eukprot:XP_004027624.1 ser thr protein phosphatase family protein, putative [Ichthyophthirius multifiliis]
MSDLDIDQHLEKLANSKYCIPERQLRLICERVKELLAEESNVQPVNSPVNICGDVHGQFFDVLELFQKGGEIPNSRYIFIGDFVDRGHNSVETIEYLICLKARYPECITLLRGNHESRQTTQAYGFYDEVQRKYGNINPWHYFCEVFDYLPLGAIVDGEIFCVHGGLSPDIKTVDQIRTIHRKQEIPLEGAFTDLLWSDPDDVSTWAINSRGAGWLFGDKVVSDFNHINDFKLICRAHQLAHEGYLYWFEQKNLCTVWSAPNYCYRMGNKASILKLDENLEREFIIFTEVEQSSQAVPPRKALPYFL